MAHLKTKKDENIIAYYDTIIFHAKQGDLDFNLPYGIIKCSKYSDPFGLIFGQDLKVKMKPGILNCYGRQVEIDSEVDVVDMSDTIDAQVHYVNVYIEINLEDRTDERAIIRVHTTGATYELINSVYRDDLYKLNHGIFLVPIAHFQYNPLNSSPFSDYGKYIKEFESESVLSINEIREEDSINNKAFASLFSKEDNKVKANKSINVEAVKLYNQNGNYSKNAPYYTVAKETSKIGGITIESVAFNLLTANRTVLWNMISTIFNKDFTTTKTFAFDHSYNKKIRIFFKGGTGKLTLPYQEKNDFFTLGQWQRFERTIDYALPEHEVIFNLPKSNTTAQFSIYVVAKFICNRYQPNHSDSWVSKRYCELELSRTLANDNDYFISTGDTGSTYTEENKNVRRTIAEIYFTKLSSTSRRARWKGRGESAEGSNGLLHWQYLTPTLSFDEPIQLAMDVVYEGGVEL